MIVDWESTDDQRKQGVRDANWHSRHDKRFGVITRGEMSGRMVQYDYDGIHHTVLFQIFSPDKGWIEFDKHYNACNSHDVKDYIHKLEDRLENASVHYLNNNSMMEAE